MEKKESPAMATTNMATKTSLTKAKATATGRQRDETRENKDTKRKETLTTMIRAWDGLTTAKSLPTPAWPRRPTEAVGISAFLGRKQPPYSAAESSIAC
jgi:hypothetical protein